METINNKEELAERQEIESDIMTYIRDILETNMGYDLTWGDLAWIRNMSHQVIAQVEQYRKEIRDANDKGDYHTAEKIMYNIPQSGFVE